MHIPVKSMLTLLLVLALAYLLLLALMFAFQRKLMYLPSKTIGLPAQYGLEGFSDERIKSADGLTLQLWYKPAATGFPTVAYFHGNAGNIGDRASIYAALAAKGFGVTAISYRGYGASEGSPTEQGLYDDARAAIGYLTKTRGVPLNRVVLFGESLGTGVAVQMATELDVAMLALQAPYRSVSGRAGEIYYFIPVKQLIRDKYHSIKKIARVKAPLLLFHGERDEVIPIHHGRSMFETATAPKRAHYLPDVGHNDFDSGMIAAHVLEFAREHKLVP